MNDYDVVVIGSGFGGSVAALRLSEKGYRVAVIEAGRWFSDDELPQTSWRLRRYLWLPAARCFGIMRMTLLRNVLIVSGTGVGGGSLVYANTLYEPLDAFYRDPQWAHITDWKSELASHYDQAKRMLGVTTARDTTAADELMRELAEEYGVSETLHAADVGVFFGDGPGIGAADPFFGGMGPARHGCTECGACMTGCRVGAKNTIVKNYLPLAQRAGASIQALTTVTDVQPISGGRYRVSGHATGNPLKRASYTAEHVVFAGNALNTQRLLHRLKQRSLPRLSPRLGELSRTNSEAVLSARSSAEDADMTHGTAITSSFYPDPQTHVEPVRYGHGSSLLALLNAHLVDPVEGIPRGRAAVQTYRKLGWRAALRMHSVSRWAEQSVIVLVMQSLDNSLSTYLKRGLFGRRMTTRQGRGEPNPEWIPTAHRVARDLSQRVDGLAGGSSADLIGIPMTAHFIGGCVIGTSITEGVIDPYQRVFGYDGLHIADGSAVTANLGVNPSLTITAQAERAMSFWPNKGDADPRPRLGEAYQRIDAVAPAHPVVPETAPGALRLPVRLPVPTICGNSVRPNNVRPQSVPPSFEPCTS